MQSRHRPRLFLKMFTPSTVRLREVEVRTAYSRFSPAHVVEELLKNPEKLTLGGANHVATVLFADVRGFTRISALMDPEDIVGVLNDYFGEMTEIIFQHGGTLDKYMGDGLMAVFGAPYSGLDDAVKAVRTAVAMQTRMQGLKGQFGSGKQGGIALGIGIGMNTGIVTVGYVGSMRRFDYTAIGDTVNMAARLESNAPAGEIYIARNTFSELNGLFPCDDLRVMVKGRDEPLDCHRVLWRQLAAAGESTSGLKRPWISSHSSAPLPRPPGGITSLVVRRRVGVRLGTVSREQVKKPLCLTESGLDER